MSKLKRVSPQEGGRPDYRPNYSAQLSGLFGKFYDIATTGHGSYPQYTRFVRWIIELLLTKRKIFTSKMFKVFHYKKRTPKNCLKIRVCVTSKLRLKGFNGWKLKFVCKSVIKKQLDVFWQFSSNRPTGPIRSSSRNVRHSIVCPLFM